MNFRVRGGGGLIVSCNGRGNVSFVLMLLALGTMQIDNP
jgi:hypothetical protein